MYLIRLKSDPSFRHPHSVWRGVCTFCVSVPVGACPLESFLTVCSPISILAAGPLAEVVCYGIGPFVTSAVARHQLALATRLVEELRPERALVFDPSMGANEHAVLASKDASVMSQPMQLIHENEHCAHAVVGPALFFMPHCSLSLFENLLRANWSADQVCVVNGYLIALTSSLMTSCVSPAPRRSSCPG